MSWPGCNYGDTGYVPSPADFAATREMVKAALDAGRLLQSAEMKDKILVMGGIVRVNTPDAFADFVKGEVGKWAKVVKAAGIRAE